MSRLVRHDAKGPVQVGEYTICQCGLSQTQPFCDSSHHTTLTEEEGKLYHYDQNDTRSECTCGNDCCHNLSPSVYKLKKD